MNVQVALFHGPGQHLERAEVPRPEPAAGEVLVRVTMCTLCGSDLHTWTGRRTEPTPTILGHEIVGRVEAVGPDAPADACGQALEPGDRITWAVTASCGSCFACVAGMPQKCEVAYKYGHEPVDRGPLLGGLGKFCLLRPGTRIFRVPDALIDEVACPANCATATAAAALRAAAPRQGDVALIHGAGMLGLTTCAMARDLGAAEVLVVDPDARRRQVAERFGATGTLAPGGDAVRTWLEERTSGRGADFAVELSGASSGVQSSIDRVRVGGRVILGGSTFPSEPVALEPSRVVRGLLRIEGIHNYSARDLANALDFLVRSEGRWPFADLVGARFTLDEAEEAFRYASTERPVRVAVVPD